MSVAREDRLARNEALFREVNERINEMAGTLGSDQDTYEYLCECSDPSCAERIPLTFEEYERVRAEGTRFVVAPGHEVHSIEEIVEQADGHEVVEKVGVAGEVAARLDPRAA